MVEFDREYTLSGHHALDFTVASRILAKKSIPPGTRSPEREPHHPLTSILPEETIPEQRRCHHPSLTKNGTCMV